MITLTDAELYAFIAAGVMFGITISAVIAWIKEDKRADHQADRGAFSIPQRGEPTEEADGQYRAR